MKTCSSSDGEMAYQVQGNGGEAFLLLHNSGGNHQMMAKTAACFAKRGKVVSPDLMGHGASSTPQRDYTFESFAEDLSVLCSQEKIENAVVIGLNVGASIGFVLQELYPHLVGKLILIEPAMLMEPWIVQVVEEQIRELEHPPVLWAEKLVESVMLKASAADREVALHALKMTPAFVKRSTFQNLIKWDRERVDKCSIASLLIQTTEPFCTEEKAREAFSDLKVGRVVGSGPWATLEAAEQVHAMIERFLSLY